ncbi:unnamed protein product [Symbiodinium sp. CCMP2592]|nr:unnamed protein product [Symbiodinium sp. CCMP2592]
MAKVTLAIACLKNRYGTEERRKPVTPAMLRWLRAHLWAGHLSEQEASLHSASFSLAFCFLLRASEYLDEGYVSTERGIRGTDVRLFKNGALAATVRSTPRTGGEVRSHFRSGLDICPVQSTIELFRVFHSANRHAEGKPLPRAVITALFQKAAAALGEPEGSFVSLVGLWELFQRETLWKVVIG